MLVVRISGGLGNQMFQWAFGKALSLQYNTSVVYDLSFYRYTNDNVTARSYELNLFEASVIELDTEEYKIQPLPGSRLGRLQLMLDRIRGKKELIRIDESEYKVLLRSTLLRKSDLYFNGYWQNEDYFKFCDHKIRQAFTPRESLLSSDTVQSVITEIRNRNSVSIHFRRGDYVTDPKTAQYHGVCSLSYYEAAVNHITQKIRNPYFYIFSDDPAWVKKNFTLSYDHHIMEDKQYSSVIDMYLMSICQHHIIANSTFSWWGAWLNDSPQKLVIVPQRWFLDVIRNEEKKNIVPSSWVRL